MRKSIKVLAPDFAPLFFVKYVNNGRFQFPLFPLSPRNTVKSGYLEVMEIMEFYPWTLLTGGLQVRALLGEPKEKRGTKCLSSLLISCTVRSATHVNSRRLLTGNRPSCLRGRQAAGGCSAETRRIGLAVAVRRADYVLCRSVCCSIATSSSRGSQDRNTSIPSTTLSRTGYEALSLDGCNEG